MIHPKWDKVEKWKSNPELPQSKDPKVREAEEILAQIPDQQELIRTTAMDVSNKLTAYIQLHDRIHTKQATLSSNVKRLLGVRVPFEEFVTEVAHMLQVWDDLVDTVSSLHEKHHQRVSVEYQAYLETLLRYVKAVQRAVTLLSDRQKLLLSISHGSEGTGETYGDLATVQAEYDLAVEQYMEIGRALNEQNATID